jgi:hypothetical protein
LCSCLTFQFLVYHDSVPIVLTGLDVKRIRLVQSDEEHQIIEIDLRINVNLKALTIDQVVVSRLNLDVCPHSSRLDA